MSDDSKLETIENPELQFMKQCKGLLDLYFSNFNSTKKNSGNIPLKEVLATDPNNILDKITDLLQKHLKSDYSVEFVFISDNWCVKINDPNKEEFIVGVGTTMREAVRSALVNFSMIEITKLPSHINDIGWGVNLKFNDALKGLVNAVEKIEYFLEKKKLASFISICSMCLASMALYFHSNNKPVPGSDEDNQEYRRTIIESLEKINEHEARLSSENRLNEDEKIQIQILRDGLEMSLRATEPVRESDEHDPFEDEEDK